MPLASGTKLGPYEIQSPLGAGGMGEVYRARDTRLDRTVAVKILPSHLSENPEAKQRFEREARAISSLNHPHICVLHDVGSQDGTSFLVMEYLQGESLEARLRKGPLPLKQALEVGIQICEALEKAHRAGIVHRDLKPGNIMLTAAGAKLLDFGLAKPAMATLAQPLSGQGQLTPSTPTMNLSALTPAAGTLTQHGTIVGTFQFMAPEVLQGREADARSDIFAFGCVLFEMITRRRAFEGKSQLSVASAILEKEPEPISTLQPSTPSALDHVVIDCLAKDPECRWQNAADVAHELRWISTVALTTAIAPEESSRSLFVERIAWAAAVVALIAALAWLGLREHPSAPTVRSYLPPPPQVGFDFTGDFSGPPVITADGTAIAFSARSAKDKDMLWVQSLGDLTPRKLDGTEGASFPFWSADGKFLGFFSEGHLKKIPAGGGPVTVLADAANPRGGAWNQDNVIIYEPDYRESLWRINASGGTAVRLTKFEMDKHTTHRWPRFLPDGQHFLFFATNHSGGAQQGIYFGSLKDGSYKHVIDSDSDAQYASGYLLYHLQSALLAQKFDADNGTVSGDPVPVSGSVEYDSSTWHTTFAASQNGILVYEPGSKAQGSALVRLDRSGKALNKIGEQAFYKGAGSLSPDGKHLAASIGDPQADIWVFDLARGTRIRLTFGGATYLMPSWSADGQKIIYVRQSGVTVVTGTSLRARLANGGGQEEILMEGESSEVAHTLTMPQWSPDGRYIVHLEQSGPTVTGVWAMPTFGDKKPFAIIQPQTPQTRIIQARLSPDGRWLAYSSTESGREEVYVTHFPSGAGKWQVSQTGGTFPSWRGDSKEIYYFGFDAFLHSATVNTKSDEFELGPVLGLFQGGYISAVGNAYDVSPDGQHFIFATNSDSVPTPLVLVTNWSAELKK
jgi:eukaryotic-like serine/threonine-protein kinase